MVIFKSFSLLLYEGSELVLNQRIFMNKNFKGKTIQHYQCDNRQHTQKR